MVLKIIKYEKLTELYDLLRFFISPACAVSFKESAAMSSYTIKLIIIF